MKWRVQLCVSFLTTIIYAAGSLQLSTNFTGNTNSSSDTLSGVTVDSALIGEIASPDVCRNTIPVPKPCDPNYRYRYFDGTCNNLKHPTWCSSLETYQRLLPAQYEGFDGARRSVLGGHLPAPRNLSIHINIEAGDPAKAVSNLLSVFGQYLSHDISQAVAYTSPPSCCVPEAQNNSVCCPILLSPEDEYYSFFNMTCIDLKRTVLPKNCDSEKRQQPNAQTGSIDGSATYGANEETANKLRLFDGTGKMKAVYSPHGEFLPRNDNNTALNFCPLDHLTKCFMSGDTRTNQHSGLSGIHTLFLREHNRVASIMKDLNPSWDDEKLYQETRRMVAAELQALVYKEYLPALLGPAAMNDFQLSISEGNASTRYNPYVRCGVYQSYAHAIGRLHTIVSPNVGLKQLRFENLYDDFALIRKGYLNVLLQGLGHSPSQDFDRFMVEDVRDHTFIFPGKPYGADLASLDIQRGRDHGIPTYVQIVNYCYGGTYNITSFNELAPLIKTGYVRLLKHNYRDVRDVDLWTGYILERHVQGAELGPIGICILGRQFHDLKFGDRFFFEHESEVPSFTPEQRESLKKSSISRIICDNNNLQQMQRNAFLLPSLDNPILPCERLPALDYNLWKENAEPQSEL